MFYLFQEQYNMLMQSDLPKLSQYTFFLCLIIIVDFLFLVSNHYIAIFIKKTLFLFKILFIIFIVLMLFLGRDSSYCELKSRGGVEAMSAAAGEGDITYCIGLLLLLLCTHLCYCICCSG